MKFLRWEAFFQQRGSPSHREGNGPPRDSEETIRQVRELLELELSTSTRDASTALRPSRSTVFRSLRIALSLYPYKLETLQNLRDGDAQKQLDLAEYIWPQQKRTEENLKKIIFSDECIFRLNWEVKQEKMARIWSDARPNGVNEHTLQSPSKLVWCTISKDRVVGPCFFKNAIVEENHTKTCYLNMHSRDFSGWDLTTISCRIKLLRITRI